MVNVPSNAVTRRPQIAAAAAVATLVAIVLAAWVWHANRPLMTAGEIVTVAPLADEDADLWRGNAANVVDAVAGHRPRPGLTRRLRMAALGDL